MKPIRLNTIGKIVWFFLIIIIILIIAFVVSLFRKEKSKPINPEKPIESEKIIDYTSSKNFEYNFDNDEIKHDIVINESATYKLIGNNENYKIVINSKDAVVKLILSNFKTSIVNNLITIKNANKVIIELEDGSENNISLDAENEEISTIIKSESDIEFIGNGSLRIEAKANFLDSQKSFILKDATIELNEINRGFNIVGDLVINSGKLYIKSTDEAINSKGNVNIEDGLLVIRAEKSITNEGLFIINGGKVFISSLNEIKKPNANSLQKTLMLNFKEQTKKMLFIHNSNAFVLAYAGEITYQHILYSDNFEAQDYILYETGKIAGTQTYGLYKIEEAEAGKQLTCPNLTNDRFSVPDIVNVYDEIVKK